MPINPQTGLYEREEPSMFAPGMFSGPLEALNANRATSLAQEHQQRTQLENMLMDLTGQRQQQDLDNRAAAINEMRGVTDPDKLALTQAQHLIPNTGLYGYAKGLATDKTREKNAWTRYLQVVGPKLGQQGMTRKQIGEQLAMAAQGDPDKTDWTQQWVDQAPDEIPAKTVADMKADEALTRQRDAHAKSFVAQANITNIRAGQMVNLFKDVQANMRANADLKRALTGLDNVKAGMLGALDQNHRAALAERGAQIVAEVRLKYGNTPTGDAIVSEMKSELDANLAAYGVSTRNAAAATLTTTPDSSGESKPPGAIDKAPDGAAEGQEFKSGSGARAVNKGGWLFPKS